MPTTETCEPLDLIVIGAGAMGLSAAFHAARAGARVRVIEAGSAPGGMAAHFDFGGVSLERFYHFICKTDFDTFDLLKELGLYDKLVWKATRMGYYSGGRLHEWGNPFALLKYPGLGPIAKFRYALMVWWCTKRKSWGKVEAMTAPDWFRAWLGKDTYQKMWKRLLELKFYEHTETVSATWIATRIQRIGRSRQSLMKEQLGHIVGGTQTLVDALCNDIRQHGGQIDCASPVVSVTSGTDGLKSVETARETLFAREVISTVPTPLAGRMIPGLTEDEHARLASIENIGVVCLVFKLRKPVTGNFWLNIIDDRHAIPGLIEFSALRDFGDQTIVYAPYYMPVTNDRWSWSDEALLD